MTGEATKKTASVDTKVEAVRRFFADSKSENHPIKEHPVTKQEEYVRDLYLEMLCVMAQYESSNTENAFTLIKRIMAACKETQPLQEYIKRSMELTPERAAEFVRQCKDNRLCEIFMVDSMLLSCANGEPNAKQVAFVTEFGDMLGFDREQMKDMSSFTLAILTQDSEGYQKLLNDENAAVQENLLGYAKEFVCGAIIRTPKLHYYYAKKPTKYQIDFEEEYQNALLWGMARNGNYSIEELEKTYMSIFGSKEAVIENTIGFGMHFQELYELKFENMVFDCDIHLSTLRQVSFEGCHLFGCTLHLESIDKILINNCIFKWIGNNRFRYEDDKKDTYYYNRAIQANLSGSDVRITNTSFTNFRVYSRNDSWTSGSGAGAVYCDTSNNSQKVNLTFEKCSFSDIYVSCSYYRDYGNYSVFCSSNGEYYVSVNQCHFSNCDNDRTGSISCLFSGYNITENNNQLINSKPIRSR